MAAYGQGCCRLRPCSSSPHAKPAWRPGSPPSLPQPSPKMRAPSHAPIPAPIPGRSPPSPACPRRSALSPSCGFLGANSESTSSPWQTVRAPHTVCVDRCVSRPSSSSLFRGSSCCPSGAALPGFAVAASSAEPIEDPHEPRIPYTLASHGAHPPERLPSWDRRASSQRGRHTAVRLRMCYPLVRMCDNASGLNRARLRLT